MKIKKILRWPFFPFLLVAMAFLDYYISWFYEIEHTGFFLVTMLALLLTALVFIICYWLLKDIKKSALVTFFFSVFLFEFQPIAFSLRLVSYKFKLYSMFRFWNSNTGQQVLFWILLLFVVILFLHYRKVKVVNSRTIVIFNMLCTVLLGLSIGHTVVFSIDNWRNSSGYQRYWDQYLEEQQTDMTAPEKNLPDIYYVVLDGFGRNDILLDIYEIENAPFIQALEERGFFVADESYSNYNKTTNSIASSMNMMYLNQVSDVIGDEKSEYYVSSNMISHSTVEELLRSNSYQTIGFFSGYNFTDLTGSDYYYRPHSIPFSFGRIILYNTALSVILNKTFFDWHREAITYTLDTLPEVTLIEGPQFIFAHILCPHPPFVFNSDGTSRAAERIYSLHDANRFLVDGTLEEYRSGYRDQIIYLQKSVLSMVDEIQKNSREPFILILQGDHGPGSETNHDILGESNLAERYGILNAIYFYDGDYNRLYPQISPVNTFRVIFSQYFGIDKPLLEDLQFESTYGDSFNFVSVDDQLK